MMHLNSNEYDYTYQGLHAHRFMSDKYRRTSNFSCTCNMHAVQEHFANRDVMSCDCQRFVTSLWKRLYREVFDQIIILFI